MILCVKASGTKDSSQQTIVETVNLELEQSSFQDDMHKVSHEVMGALPNFNAHPMERDLNFSSSG